MQGINPLTMKCTYETPCGWCTKWDKKCDRKIPERGLRVKMNPIDEVCEIPTEFGKCIECVHEGWSMPQCKECNTANNFKYFERKKNINENN